MATPEIDATRPVAWPSTHVLREHQEVLVGRLRLGGRAPHARSAPAGAALLPGI